LDVFLVKLFRGVSTMLKRMTTEDCAHDRASDIDALTNWAQHAASARRASEPPPSGVSFTSTVVGVVQRVDADNLWLRGHASLTDDDASDVGVYHHVPPSVDLGGLVGRSVRVTMVCKPGAGEHLERTLTVSGDDGRVWLLARSGMVQGERHALTPSCGERPLHAALSQRPLGPLVVGTSELQCLVPVGRSALLRMGDGSMFRAHLVKRRDDGTASYVIADASLFAEPLS
jgi:hypothetical protein